mmetsp:Transcript_29455/g.57683  ORF Transcript_29455/g.57683 Transcript_29455/m.57683 type:complete len:316 (+) Transcript_29455:156-1103(+)
MLELVFGLAVWGGIAAVWVASLALPILLLRSLSKGQWRHAVLLGTLIGLPHIIQIRPLPLSTRQVILNGMVQWFPRTKVYAPPQLQSDPHLGHFNLFHHGDRPQLYCIHPHGIYTVGALMLLRERPDVRLCVGAFLYNFAPLFRMLPDMLGLKVGSVGKTWLAACMAEGQDNLAIVPGGFHEATISCRGHERVFLRTRKGFVKYALRNGYDLVPCYNFGETDLFSNLQGIWRRRFALNVLNIPTVLPWGAPLLPALPRRRALVLAIGQPVHMPHIECPTKEEVDRHHARYVMALEKLYADASRGTPSEGRPLEVW